ncbi:uncharacterized protein LOC127281039 [Leptopilina boulardi]|uniref:uncharacterized protein LOC127281039 n=1 Tax=Leptopilina boulardi TaxID=63433 RepID=UPI0021F67A31|nr:uncharacterized protein LOC127281039 [Leptopilina boulardi]
MIRTIKLLIDTIIHGYTLYTVFGWSFQLLGCIWDSVTNLLLHLGKPEVPQKPDTQYTQQIRVPEEEEEEKDPTKQKQACQTLQIKQQLCLQFHV